MLASNTFITSTQVEQVNLGGTMGKLQSNSVKVLQKPITPKKKQPQPLKRDLSEDYIITKSMKRIFEQLEFNMANNEVSDGGARNKADLDRKERLMKITEEEKKRYKPTWAANTFA